MLRQPPTSAPYAAEITTKKGALEVSAASRTKVLGASSFDNQAIPTGTCPKRPEPL